MVDLLRTITCNGKRAFEQTWLIGEGRAFNVYTDLSNGYPSSSLKLRYFNSSPEVAVSELSACTPETLLVVGHGIDGDDANLIFVVLLFVSR